MAVALVMKSTIIGVISLTMASRQNAPSTQEKPGVSKQRDQGTLRSLIYSDAVQSDPPTGKRPRGIEKERPRRSARLGGISRLLKSSEDSVYKLPLVYAIRHRPLD